MMQHEPRDGLYAQRCSDFRSLFVRRCTTCFVLTLLVFLDLDSASASLFCSSPNYSYPLLTATQLTTHTNNISQDVLLNGKTLQLVHLRHLVV